MESSIDFSALIVKTNVSGIFRIIPSLAFEYSGAPLLYFALKVVEPGYLGILNCKYRLCYALAPVDKMPHHEHNRLQEEASRLGYRGRRGKSYLYQGHEWMPIPEDDEKNYWEYNNEKKEIKKDGKVVGQRSIEVFPSDDSKDKNEEEKLIPNPLVAANEEELKGRCDKIEPELWSDPKPRKVIDPDKIPVTSDELNDAEKYYLEDTQTVEPQQQENNLAKQNGPLKEIKQEYKNQNDAKGSPGYTEEYTIKRKNEDTNTNSKNTDTKDTNTEDTNSKNTSTKDTKKKSTDPKKKKTDPKKKNTKTKKKNKKTKKAEHDDCESCYEMRAVSGDHDADLPEFVKSGTTSHVKSSHREIQYKDSKLPDIKGYKPEKGVNYFKY
ncbi:uncharacterized protein LOC126055198 [Helicoverpa armigera]|uniref:uncharacterized protein LOC126055198 n=1 Tax=Helicoverpa armigera TaxID=29058 RepID=UPI003082EC10